MKAKKGPLFALQEACEVALEHIRARQKELDEREAALALREKTLEESLRKSDALTDNDIVTFDVGGQLFKYNAEQIHKYPESVLCVTMERWCAEGRVPIFTRSALLFAYVDSFLKEVPLCSFVENGAKAEFDFYGLPFPLPEPVPDAKRIALTRTKPYIDEYGRMDPRFK